MTEVRWALRKIFPSNHQFNVILQEETTVGRSISNSICCPSIHVCEHHCVFSLTSCGDVNLRDLGSTYGTTINCETLIKNIEVILREGDVIGIGIKDGSNINYDNTAYLFKLFKIPAQVINALGDSPYEECSSTLRKFSDPIVTQLSTNVPNNDIEFITLPDSDNEFENASTVSNDFEESSENTPPILAGVSEKLNKNDYVAVKKDALPPQNVVRKLQQETKNRPLTETNIPRKRIRSPSNVLSPEIPVTSDSTKVGSKRLMMTNSSECSSKRMRYSNETLSEHSTDVSNKIADDTEVMSLSDSDDKLDDTITVSNDLKKTIQNTTPILNFDKSYNIKNKDNVPVKKDATNPLNVVNKLLQKNSCQNSVDCLDEPSYIKCQQCVKWFEMRRRLDGLPSKKCSTTLKRSSDSIATKLSTDVPNNNSEVIELSDSENELDDTNTVSNGFVESSQNTQPILAGISEKLNKNDNVPVKKDALPPQNVVRKLQKKRNTSQNSFDYLDETIYIICQWCPKWFEEQKSFSTNKPPPVSPTSVLECKEAYDSYKDYRSTIYPLLLQELWANLTIAWEYRRNTVYVIASDNFRHNSPLQEVKVISRTVSPDKQTSKFIHIHCHTLLDSDVFIKNIYPHFGDLVLVEFSNHLSDDNDEEPKYLEHKLIGYIYRATPMAIIQYPTKVRPELFAKYPQCKTVLHMVLRINQGKCLTVDETSFGRIWILKSIKADLRLFRALDKLQESPLLPQVLNPNYNKYIQNSPMDLPELVSYDNAPLLNQSQREAVLTTAKLCLEESDKERIHLIHGPPGTGKSQVIISLIMQLWMNLCQNSNEHPRILVCTQSNGAIDELFLRLMEIRTTLSGHKKFRLVRNGCIKAIHSSVRCLALNTLSKRHAKKSIEMLERSNFHKVEGNKKIDKNTINKMHADAETKLLEGANIVATTLASCYNTQMKKAFSTDINNKRFICCIIDEATQASEPETLIPLMLRVNHLILVGDPKQLPPTVRSVLAKQNGLNKPLFTRHQMWWDQKEKIFNIKNMLLHFLDRQYRMHPAIAEWPSELFYNKLLLTDENVEPLRRSPLLPYIILTHDYEQGEEGKINPREGALVRNIVCTIRNTDTTKEYSIGIITPWNKQKLSLAKYFCNLAIPRMEIGTIDSFQGNERDVIILLCLKTDGVGLNFNLQRLNVALTRAKNSLIICGNLKSFQQEIWTMLYKNALDRNVIRPVSPFMSSFSGGKSWEESQKYCLKLYINESKMLSKHFCESCLTLKQY